MPQEIDKISPVRKLQEWDARTVAEVIEARGETTIVIAREHLLKVAGYLATEPSLNFSFLSDIATVDRFPLEPRFEVNYQLLSIDLPVRLRLKVKLSGQRSGDSLGFRYLAHRGLARAREFRPVRHSFRGPSESAAHRDAGRVGRPSACARIIRRRGIADMSQAPGSDDRDDHRRLRRRWF